MIFVSYLLSVFPSEAKKNKKFEIIFDFSDVRNLPLTPPPPHVRSCPLLADPPSPFGADVLYGWPFSDFDGSWAEFSNLRLRGKDTPGFQTPKGCCRQRWRVTQAPLSGTMCVVESFENSRGGGRDILEH